MIKIIIYVDIRDLFLLVWDPSPGPGPDSKWKSDVHIKS